MPLDFVAEVTCLRVRLRASSNANFMMRSVPRRVNTESCEANSVVARLFAQYDSLLLERDKASRKALLAQQ